MSKPIFDRWWKWKFRLFRITPQKCPYCNGEIISKGYEHNLRLECKVCNQTLIDYTL